MFKLAIPLQKDLQLDDAETLIGLREKYPGCYFKTGMQKDQITLFVLCDLTTREYGTPKKLPDGTSFYPPKNLDTFSLDTYENSKDLREFKVEVKLISGRKIWVKPATLEPQTYSLLSDEVETEYSQATEYGRLAYSLFDDISKDKNIKLNDERIKKFIKLLVSSSYSIPIVVFDNLGLISMNDIMNLISAGLGINENILEVKKNT